MTLLISKPPVRVSAIAKAYVNTRETVLMATHRDWLIAFLAQQNIALEYNENFASALGVSYGGKVAILPGSRPPGTSDLGPMQLMSPRKEPIAASNAHCNKARPKWSRKAGWHHLIPDSLQGVQPHSRAKKSLEQASKDLPW